MTSALSICLRSEWMWWRVFFGVWIGTNLLILFGPNIWEEILPSTPRPSWSVRWQYKAAAWPPAGKTEATQRMLNYRVLEPTRSATPQPLLIFLHGAGERGDDNMLQLRGLPAQLIEPAWRKLCPGFVLAPQCPSNSDWGRELPLLISLIESWRSDPRIDRRRVYLTGVSMGGYGTWRLAAAKPDWFAAAVPICGGGDLSTAPKLSMLPIWAVHGSDDSVVPPDQSRQMIEAIRAAGGNPKYTELSGVGHDSWSQTYHDKDGVLSWMYQQVDIRDL